LSTICNDSALTVSRSECLALVDFYVSTQGYDWTDPDTSGWLQDPVVDNWLGVTTLSDGSGTLSGNNVVYIELPTNNLQGSISSSIGDLQELRRLYIQGNNISAGMEYVPNASALERLYAWGNNFT
jgi:Leucine-rich repeat (LRR) protein